MSVQRHVKHLWSNIPFKKIKDLKMWHYHIFKKNDRLLRGNIENTHIYKSN